MSYELQGTVKLIYPVQTFGSGFTKREIVITTDQERYPQDIKLEFVKDKCTMLDKVALGQRVKASFDIRGSEYNGKYFVNLTGWKIGPAEGGGNSDGGPMPEDEAYAPAPSRGSRPTPPPPPPPRDYGDDDDMPF